MSVVILKGGERVSAVGPAKRQKMDVVDGVTVKKNVERPPINIVTQSPSVLGARFTMPVSRIRSPEMRHLEVDPAEYDLDSEDEEWLAEYNYDRDPRRSSAMQSPLQPSNFERAMTQLLSNQGRAAKPVDAAGPHHAAVLAHFRKRVANGADYLMPQLSIGTGNEEEDDAYACFAPYALEDEPMAALPTPSQNKYPYASTRWRPSSPLSTTTGGALGAPTPRSEKPARKTQQQQQQQRGAGLQMRSVNDATSRKAGNTAKMATKQGIAAIKKKKTARKKKKTRSSSRSSRSSVGGAENDSLFGEVLPDARPSPGARHAIRRVAMMLSGMSGASASPLAGGKRVTRQAAHSQSARATRRNGRLVQSCR